MMFDVAQLDCCWIKKWTRYVLWCATAGRRRRQGRRFFLVSKKRSIGLLFATLVLLTFSWQVDIVSHTQQHQHQQGQGSRSSSKSSWSNLRATMVVQFKQQRQQQPSIVVPNYQRWNHVNHSIIDSNSFTRVVVVDKHNDDGHTTNNDHHRPTSLEILQSVLEEYHHQEEEGRGDLASFSQQNAAAAAMDDKNSACLRPDLKQTQRLVRHMERQRRQEQKRKSTTTTTDHDNHSSTTNTTIAKTPKTTLPYPVLNMGFPKAGSSSLMRWFQNAGKNNVSHFVLEQQKDGEATSTYVGLQMLDNVLAGQSPFAGDALSHYQVHAQMDYTGGDDPTPQQRQSEMEDATMTTIFPQIQLLDEIHAAEPNATFVLLFRPVTDWIRSTQSWNRYPFRWAEHDIPGLVLTDQQRYERDVLHERIVVTPTQLQDWWCTHVMHIRRFVRQYPSHHLIELDLSDNRSSDFLSALFDVDPNTVSWNKANSSNRNKRGVASNKGNGNQQQQPAAAAVASSIAHHLQRPRLRPHQLWNFTTNTMDSGVGNNITTGSPTFSSLQVLSQVMHMHDGDKMMNGVDDVDDGDDSCFRPIQRRDETTTGTSTISSFPILNVGLPMDPWNDLLKDFFSCLGMKVTGRKGQGGKFGSTGKKIKQAVEAGMMPLGGYFGPRDVYTQLDYTATLNSSQGIHQGEEERSVFPQIQLLDEIHAEVPTATLLLPYPTFDEWMDFAQSFHNFTERWARMEMPGLVLTEEQYAARPLPCPVMDDEVDENGVAMRRCVRLSDAQLKQWWCGHVRHIRNLVKEVYPSHSLWELDLSDLGAAKRSLQTLFPHANETCLSTIVD